MAGQFVIKQIAQEVISEVNQPLYIGGKLADGSDAKITVASNGNVSTATPLTVPSLTVGGNSTNFGAWIDYTPTWTASVTNPTIGNGFVVGRYCKIGKTVFVSIQISIGSSTNIGSGWYKFGLPSNLPYAHNGYYGNRGNSVWSDSSAATQYLLGIELHTEFAYCLVSGTGSYGIADNTRPFVLASTDGIGINLVYETTA